MLHTSPEPFPRDQASPGRPLESLYTPGFVSWAVFSRCYAPGDPDRRGKLLFRLHQDLVYISRAGELYTVPAGYVSDLGSVPRFLWPILPPHEFPSAYFLHDRGYDLQDEPREKIDLLLYESLLLSHAPPWKAALIYKGVRIGGGGHWKG